MLGLIIDPEAEAQQIEGFCPNDGEEERAGRSHMKCLNRCLWNLAHKDGTTAFHFIRPYADGEVQVFGKSSRRHEAHGSEKGPPLRTNSPGRSILEHQPIEAR